MEDVDPIEPAPRTQLCRAGGNRGPQGSGALYYELEKPHRLGRSGFHESLRVKVPPKRASSSPRRGLGVLGSHTAFSKGPRRQAGEMQTGKAVGLSPAA